MRLGAPIWGHRYDPEPYFAKIKSLGYGAAYCMLEGDESDDLLAAFEKAAAQAGIVIAEVGAWRNNPLHPDEATSKEAIANIQKKLALADKIGARCCVNVAGSLDPDSWAGPHMHNLDDDVFDLVVETARAIIDGVKPTRTYFTLEMMPWMFPDSADSYLKLIDAIDRERFGVHLDPVNIVCTPRAYFYNADLLRECFEKLGPHIRSIHAKDMIIKRDMPITIHEILPGKGALDYVAFLKEANKLDPDVPFMLEHLQSPEEYAEATQYVREQAKVAGVEFVI